MHAGKWGSGLFEFILAINGVSFITLSGLNGRADNVVHGTVWTGRKTSSIAELSESESKPARRLTGTCSLFSFIM